MERPIIDLFALKTLPTSSCHSLIFRCPHELPKLNLERETLNENIHDLKQIHGENKPARSQLHCENQTVPSVRRKIESV